MKKIFLLIGISLIIFSCTKEEEDCQYYEMVNTKIERWESGVMIWQKFPEEPDTEPSCDYPETQTIVQGVRDEGSEVDYTIYYWERMPADIFTTE
jgi:hypothetical protein